MADGALALLQLAQIESLTALLKKGARRASRRDFTAPIAPMKFGW
jgi:hypothetical protein